MLCLFKRLEYLDISLRSQDLMHASCMILDRGSRHKCTFGFRRIRIDLIGQLQKIVRLQVNILRFSYVYDFGECRLEQRVHE